MSESPALPSYEELASLVAVQGVRLAEQAKLLAEQAALLAEQAALIEVLRAELAATRRAAGRDSSNSSLPVCHEREGGERM